MDFVDITPSTMDPPPGPYPTSINTILCSLFSGVIIIALIAPFLSLHAAKQLSACTVIIVTQLVLFFTFINAILWPNDNIANWWNGHGLCDIEVIVRSVSITLIASSTASLTRNLSQAVDVDNNPCLFESAGMKRRRLAVEILFCFGVPFIQLICHYFVQAGRYAILAVYGCTDVISNSWFTVFLFIIWPPIFCLLNCYYATLVIIRLHRHRGRLSSTLNSSGSSFTARRFIKLFFLCILFFILQLPLTLAFFYFNLKNNIPLQAFSWSKVHDPAIWPMVIYFTSEVYPIQQYYGWPPVLMGLGVTLFYSVNKEAIDRYRQFAVLLGLGKFWPKLKEPREMRRRVHSSHSSWSSHLDFVGKAVRYFDGVRKQSVTAEMAQDTTRSRKDSATTTTLTNITSHCTSPITSDSAAHCNSNAKPEVSRPEKSHHRQPFLSAFRTHYNFPFQLFPHRKSSNRDKDLEAQQPRRFSDNNAAEGLDQRGQTIETNIWSGPPAPKVVQEEFIDPQSPKLGTRAYRERERREHERDKASERLEGASRDDELEKVVKVSKSLDQISVITPSRP